MQLFLGEPLLAKRLGKLMLCIRYVGQPIAELKYHAPWVDWLVLTCPDGSTLICMASDGSTLSARPGDWLILLSDDKRVRHETNETFSTSYELLSADETLADARNLLAPR